MGNKETDAISYTRGVLDGIKKERERIKKELEGLAVIGDKPLLDNEDEVFIDEITKRCCDAPWGTIHSEVQYTALHFKTKSKQAQLSHTIKELKERLDGTE